MRCGGREDGEEKGPWDWKWMQGRFPTSEGRPAAAERASGLDALCKEYAPSCLPDSHSPVYVVLKTFIFFLIFFF